MVPAVNEPSLKLHTVYIVIIDQITAFMSLKEFLRRPCTLTLTRGKNRVDKRRCRERGGFTCLEPLRDLAEAVLEGRHVHGSLSAQQLIRGVCLEISIHLRRCCLGHSKACPISRQLEYY
jgi:hypothetical protein